MPKNYRFHYQVRGQGSFPVDMLRYDQAWPEREEDSGHIASTFHRVPHSGSIRLTGLDLPTIGRWLSFGWIVDDGVSKVEV